MSAIVPGAHVRVITNANELDPNTYRLDSFDGPRAMITCLTTNVQMAVHRSRVFAADDGKTEEQIMTEANKKAAAKAPKVKTAGAAKKVVERIPFDFSTELSGMGSGAEHWRKTNSFDHEAITSEAHVLISGDKTWFRSLNTYDGSLGKNGKTGQKYDLKDYAKKTKELQTRGYAPVNVPVEV